MYVLGPELENATVGPGTNILLAGPPLTGKRRLSLEILAHGSQDGDGSVIVSTRDRGERVIHDFEAIQDGNGEGPLGVVDCVTKHQGVSATDGSDLKYASSPEDMTGIGIKFSQFIEDFNQRGHTNNRISVDSLTTLLFYSDLQTVFRFMHVLTGRIESAGGMGIHLIESTAHDNETMNTIKQLFDGVIETDQNREVRIQLPTNQA